MKRVILCEGHILDINWMHVSIFRVVFFLSRFVRKRTIFAHKGRPKVSRTQNVTENYTAGRLIQCLRSHEGHQSQLKCKELPLRRVTGNLGLEECLAEL